MYVKYEPIVHFRKYLKNLHSRSEQYVFDSALKSQTILHDVENEKTGNMNE